MKLKTNLTVLGLLTLLFSYSAVALTGDSEQPINIESNNQSLDLTSNVVTFTDNVVITQGSVKINADKVIITRPNEKEKASNKKETVDAFGVPVKFQQQLDNGKMVYGNANKVHYDLGKEFLTLIGNAQLKQEDSRINGDLITYDVKKQQLKANGNGGRVKTVLIPNQLKTN
ncbi:ABC transporter substrate-binding protein [Gallibacterium salpingitidis]|uniref:lipopolysaccharide transport periplasmic protein LptA n=1 Tax=Gallibacterium salpingitidis TaxID=505341 RepID=UPI000804DC82|nr:lipopolysaccharide transport periplasmic protein LptA [Gallibacterium salpingitidis]OBX08690.1 ABC transporter substrate-binding protein [Gallibacterium salpingitidis]